MELNPRGLRTLLPILGGYKYVVGFLDVVCEEDKNRR